MIITESGAFRKGHPANLVNPFRDSGILFALQPKLYTQCVENLAQPTVPEAGEGSIVARASSVTIIRGVIEALALPMTYQENNMPLAVDAVIPVYGEQPEALAATLSACLKQTYPFSRIFVIDDGSPEPICLPHWTQSLPQLCLLRLPENLGISAARKGPLDLVGGYDVRYRRHHEDSDICKRMRKCGWETHYVARSRCISIQEDSFKELVAKELRESYWYSPTESSLIHLYGHLSKWTLIRAGRNLIKGRFYFIPVDAAIWASGLWTATLRTLRSLSASNGGRALRKRLY